MTDIALRWDNALFAADLALDAGALATDEGLRTAILISLFTDARAEADDPLPYDGADRRGWWGNGYPPAADSGAGERRRDLGSKLWLLARAKTTAATLERARAYARDALAWLTEDRIVSALDVAVERQADGPTERLAIAVILTRPDGPARQRYDFVWEASL